MEHLGIVLIVNVYVSVGKIHHFLMGNQRTKWQFSMAMLVYQRVVLMVSVTHLLSESWDSIQFLFTKQQLDDG